MRPNGLAPIVGMGGHVAPTMLRQLNQQLTVATDGPGFTRLGAAINRVITASGLQQGLCVVLAMHTSCSQKVRFT